MERKHIAAIMKRYPLKEEIFLFQCQGVKFGEYDRENRSFLTEDGKTYKHMLDDVSIIGEEEYDAFFNLADIEEISKDTQNKIDIDALAAKYEQKSKEVAYMVGRSKLGNHAYYPINVDEIMAGVDYAYNHAYSILEPEEKKETIVDTFTKLIDQLESDLIEKDFETEELKNTQDGLLDFQIRVDEVISSIDLKIETLETENEVEEEPQEIIKPREGHHYEQKTEPKPVNIKVVYENIKKTIIAQDLPALRTIIEVDRKEKSEALRKRGILLTGPSGVGKTKLMSLIAENFNRPFIKIDSTGLTVPGYTGTDIEEELWKLYEKCNYDVKLAEQAIVLFDEIDKKGKSNQEDVGGQGVLNVLLPFIEGSEYGACPSVKTSPMVENIDTTNMIIVLAGAFSEVYEHINKNNTAFGFETEENKKVMKHTKATKEDFIKYGNMTKEFMGRVDIVELNELDVENLIRILYESNESPLRVEEEVFEKIGVKITFTEGYIKSVAKAANDKKTGARGLAEAVDDSTCWAYGDAQFEPGQFEEIILTEETVKDPHQYQYVKRKEEIKTN